LHFFLREVGWVLIITLRC